MINVVQGQRLPCDYLSNWKFNLKYNWVQPRAAENIFVYMYSVTQYSTSGSFVTQSVIRGGTSRVHCKVGSMAEHSRPIRAFVSKLLIFKCKVFGLPPTSTEDSRSYSANSEGF